MMQKKEVLKKYFGYDDFRKGQEILIDSILSGQDVLGIMPTGAGKSICYQLPALMMEGITIVISPLISLMKDQVQALNQAGVHAAYINSSLTEKQIEKALELAINGQYKIIYVAPERLETYGFQRFSRTASIDMITIDEAHCISQWGQDFRPSYLKIVQYIEQLPKRPVVSAFTATATEVVKTDIETILKLQQPNVLVTGFDRKNLYFEVCHTRKKDAFILEYVEKHRGDSGIIYCATRKNVDSLYTKLKQAGILAAHYHAGLTIDARRENQDAFIYDQAQIMVATNAFGMGIDKSNVRFVIHYNMPQSLENYYQEAGRAGRDGEASECILLYSPQDLVINRLLIASKSGNEELDFGEQKEVQNRDEQRLQIMNQYCLTNECLRNYILNYFGEQAKEPCENCSNCNAEFNEIDVTELAKNLIGCIAECRQRYGMNVIVGTLRGEKKAKLLSYGVDRLESYGRCQGESEIRLKQILNQMVQEKLLILTEDKYTLVKLTKSSQQVVDGKRSVFLKVNKKAEQEETRRTVKKTISKVKKTDTLSETQQNLFEKLRSLRRAIAVEEGVPPYIVFSDKTLIDMCEKLPGDKTQLLDVSGVGEHKYEKYGKRFLQCIKENR